jgi:hypothetical protein
MSIGVAGAGSTLIGGVASAASTPSCALAPPSLIKSSLGLVVSTPTAQTSPNNLGCYYPMGSVSDEVTITFTTHETLAKFNAFRASEDKTVKSQTVKGLGTSAFAQVLGGGSYAIVTLEVLKGTTALSVGVQGSLIKTENLAKAILAKI